MNELIKVTNNSEGIPTVNARELHTYLESKRDFSTWIKDKIKSYGFIESTDYTLHKIVERVDGYQGGGSVTSIEYFITLDMAKHLGMVERNKKGREIREYFIKVEKEYIALKQKELEQEIKEIKAKKRSVDTRNLFTDTIKDNVANPSQVTYIAATLATKFSLNIPVNKSKEMYTETERNLTIAAEAIAAEKIKLQQKKLNTVEINNIILSVGSEIINSAGIARTSDFYDELLAPTMTEREKLVDIVHRISAITQKSIADTWVDEVYKLMERKFHINIIKETSKNKNAIPLDVIMAIELNNDTGNSILLSTWLIGHLIKKYTSYSKIQLPLKISPAYCLEYK
jgi:phage anti-repressor protein